MPDATAPEVLVAFGRALRRLRHERGMSQERLADEAGLHRTYVGDIERGVRNVGLVNVDRLARALRVDLSSLFAAVDAAKR
jgi:transcriptional regulator with XRE-family HTH domain